MTLEEMRDKLLREQTDEKKNPEYKHGYADGVLDMYNEEKKEKLNAVVK